MNYISTRNNQITQRFSHAVLDGLSHDGGLYVPESLPDLSGYLTNPVSYTEMACGVFTSFMAPDFTPGKIQAMLDSAYSSFSETNVVQLKQYDSFNVLELFHGPTLAFKDIALQFLGQVLSELLAREGLSLTVLGATSGDTGGAAIAGLAGNDQCRVFMLYPTGRISKVQEAQMTANISDNIFPIAIDGSFDDAQNIVKQLFADAEVRQQLNLTAVNSINWCRIMAQMVYYFYAYQLAHNNDRNISSLSFSVPTGNFGDVLAGYYAYRCGLPVNKLIVACNSNDLLARIFESGVYQPLDSKSTLSPAMDIQVASNFERLLFELSGRNSEYIKEKMAQLQLDGLFKIEDEIMASFRQLFEVYSISDTETADIMRTMSRAGFQVDPHTAVGMCAKERSLEENVICLSTAHPIKFSESIKQITGTDVPCPTGIAELLNGSQRKYNLSNQISDIKSFLLSRP